MGITTKEYHEGYQQGYKEAKEEFQNTLCKYQKIQEIVKAWREVGLDYDSCDAMDNIERVIENGNDD